VSGEIIRNQIVQTSQARHISKLDLLRP